MANDAAKAWGSLARGARIETDDGHMVGVLDVLAVFRAVYDRAATEFKMNEVPHDVVVAARAAEESARSAVRDIALLAARVHHHVVTRDGPEEDPPKEATDDEDDDVKARSSHRPSSR